MAVASAGPCARLHLTPDITMPVPHHSVFLQAECPSCHPTNSVKALKVSVSIICMLIGWWRGTVVERRSLAGKLSLSCARPAADG